METIMRTRIENLIKEYWMLISYGIFGVLTTAVNLGCYYICARILKIPVMISSLIAWVAGVVFAYITNRIWVFESKNDKKKEILKEVFSFVCGRGVSEVIELAILFIFVSCLHYNDIFWKVISNIVVIIFNYIFSKFIVFRKKVNIN